MGINDNLFDPYAAIRDVIRRIRNLETASPLSHSSISHGTDIGVRIPAGIHMEDGGSATAGSAYLDSANGGRVGAGSSYFRSDGALANLTGTLPIAVNVTGAANLTFEGQVRGRGGVVGPVNGVQTELGAAVAEADRKGQSGYNNAMAARDEAAAAKSAASTAQSRADSAHSLASNRASQADFIDLANAFYVQVARVDALVQKVDSMKASYELHLREFHGGWGT